jgi:tetratricopeptide (TPR) repeat protein
MAIYDAFISYSHAKDQPIATALQTVVQKLGKPWYRRRALRVFRDNSSLSATPHLWTTIEQALDQSRFLIVLASPQAAVSPWVNKEVTHWLDRKNIDTLLIALTDGTLFWDGASGDFLWSADTPLPPPLKGRFPTEPRWVDLRRYRDDAKPGDQEFIQLGADFAAAVRGVPKEDLFSEELRQQRRALTLAWSAACTLLVLAGLAGWQWREAAAQRDRAEQTLAAATRSANDLIVNVAARFRHTVGIPVDIVRDILARAQHLQGELIKYHENDPDLRRSQAVALRETSQTLLFQGDTEAALAEAEKSRKIMDALIASDPRNPDLRHELSLSYNRIGEALSRAGRRNEALTVLLPSLAIRKELAADEPHNNERQRSLALSFELVGNEQFTLARHSEALDSYRESFAIREKIARAEPDNRDAQRDLAISYDRIGRTHGDDSNEALEAYRKGLAIRQTLVQADPRSSLWQRDLASSHDSVGTILLKKGEREAALRAFLDALKIREMLMERDPGNPQWQIILVISLFKLADANDDPVGRFKRALAMVRELERSGKLGESQKNWRVEIEQRLAALTP